MKKIKVLLVYPNLMLVSTLPNNIALLSGCLTEDGNDVRLFDATLYRTAGKSNDEMRMERMQVRRFDIKEQGVTLKEKDIYDDFEDTVENYKPDLIGVTVVDDTVRMGLSLIERVRKKWKKIPVIFGGVHVYFNADRLINNSAVDMLCVGEGEAALVELCRRLKLCGSLTDVPNLWFKDNTGNVVKNPLAVPVDLDTLPFEDFSIFEEQRFYRPMQGRMLKMLPVNFDRGCPYQCAFCNAPAINAIYRKNKIPNYCRRKSITRIYGELKYQLKRHSVEYLYFNSETFLAIPVRQLREFAEMYSEFHLPFWCQTRVETVTDEKIKILKEMNCDRISIGLEHGNEKFRGEVLKKNFSNKDVVNAFKIFEKYEIKTSVNNIMGLPGETRRLIFDTIRLNKRLKADSVSGLCFQPYTGTELRALAIREGFLPGGDSNTETQTPIGDPVLDMPGISKEELKGLLRTFVLYVKMPKAYYPKIAVAERLDAEGDAALAELREIFFEKYFKS